MENLTAAQFQDLLTGYLAGLPPEQLAEILPERPASICSETRTHVTTSEAARLLNRKEQTLRNWACFETGPIRPIRVHGKLAWPTSEIRRLLQVA